MTPQIPPAAALRRAAFLVVLALVAVAGLATSAAGSGSPTTSSPSAAGPGGFIVRARAGHESSAEALVRRLGGTVRLRLKIIDGFSASLPEKAIAALRSNRAILSVTRNRKLQPQSSSYSTSYDPSSDPYSMSAVAQLTGARAWWSAGYTGQGVDVALIDSGVAPVQGLSGSGKLMNGPDLSLESQAPNLRYLDTYGHGTFMAGLIAGRDAAPSAQATASTYLGMAPNARIVSVKVANADGGTDVTQVIAALDWIVQHRTDNGLNIRVINLSYGTNSTQDSGQDPLAFAAEQAWKKGIVVVAAAGNTGYQGGWHAPGLADPAYDPFVIGVGAVDTMGTLKTADDQITSFSARSCGWSCKDPDFAAPGAHMQGLRVPNSWIDVNHPEGFLSSRYFRGSGTSESTAVTTGAIALVLQKFPNLTPDGVKRFLADNAFKLGGSDSHAQGPGEIQLAPMLAKTPSGYSQNFNAATGTGRIEDARGQDHLTRDNVTLSGEKDIFGSAIDVLALAQAEAAGNSWSGGNWNGKSWSGNSWSGNSWSTSTWSGNSWSGNSWSGSSWSGNSWSGGTWAGAFWG